MRAQISHINSIRDANEINAIHFKVLVRYRARSTFIASDFSACRVYRRTLLCTPYRVQDASIAIDGKLSLKQIVCVWINQQHIKRYYLQFNGLLIDPEQKSSIICFVLFLVSASHFSFVSAFTTKQSTSANPCTRRKIIKQRSYKMYSTHNNKSIRTDLHKCKIMFALYLLHFCLHTYKQRFSLILFKRIEVMRNENSAHVCVCVGASALEWAVTLLRPHRNEVGYYWCGAHRTGKAKRLNTYSAPVLGTNDLLLRLRSFSF